MTSEDSSSHFQNFSGGGHNFTSFTDSNSAPLPLPSTDNYFSIDDILASQQNVPVEFNSTVYHLGYLNPSSQEEHLEAGLKMELPFWLARVLGSRKRQVLNVELPKSFREPQRDILSADASVVDLYKLCPYYYILGVKLLDFDHLDTQDLSRSLLETFLNRFRKIMDHSQNAFEADTFPLTSGLDETERTLFQVGKRATKQLDLWEKGTCHKITSSAMVQVGKKRKRHSSS